MFNYGIDYDNTFNIPSKGRRRTPDPKKDQLICNNCINKELMEAKRQREKELENTEIPNDVQDRLNRMRQDQIQNKINKRIKLSEEAAKNLRGIPKEKEKLIRENENATFFLNDAQKIGKDPLKDKIMKNFRNNKGNRNLNKSFDNSSKRKIDNYYRKYVDNYKEPERTDANKKYDQMKYINDLENQIENNQRLKANRQKYENDIVNKHREKENEIYLKNMENERLKKQKLKQIYWSKLKK